MAIKLNRCLCYISILLLIAPNKLSFANKSPDKMPDNISAFDFNTNKITHLSSFKNQIIYIDFWASWCKPCRKILPALDKLYQQYHSKNLTIIAINIDKNKADAHRFLNQHPITYPHLYDPKGLIGNIFNVRVIPTGILFARNGQILAYHQGYREGDIEKLEQKIIKLLNP